MEHKLLDGLNNYFASLDKDIHARLREVLVEQTDATWNAAYSVILRADVRGLGLTLWQAVLAVDPTYLRIGPCSSSRGPREKWERVPDRDTLIAALRYAQTLPSRDEVNHAAN